MYRKLSARNPFYWNREYRNKQYEFIDPIVMSASEFAEFSLGSSCQTLDREDFVLIQPIIDNDRH
ncbi:hypothetical protein BAURA63_03281 [Brevibacterium aurantiacum]|uniref:Uncharacterized protein n=1 Tax=Brevibacterium aurantiacum TaxID=273384 RepID=A0A2H1KFM9_BREAU|nr:hypothetical protein BAURA63_03281 [Brevibacterium aurantiacum]